MSITRKAVASLMGVAALSAVTVLDAGAATAERRSAEFNVAVQNVADNLNLDYLHTPQVETRDPGGQSQEWTFTLVGRTADGEGIYTIRWGDRSCLEDLGLDQQVLLRYCEGGSLAQRWIVDTAQDHTTIASQKNPNQVLQGNGEDQRVTTTPVFGEPAPNQLWTLYQP
ncbi:RICIN domain-containing protein [Kitasatospora sp. NPDC004531]